MAQNDKIQLFEDKRIRTAWDEEKEEWYFSIVDVCEVLSGTDNPRRYWSDLKRKLKSEGAVEQYEKIVQFDCARWQKAPDRRSRHRADSPNHPVYSFAQSGTVQVVVGTGWTGAH